MSFSFLYLPGQNVAFVEDEIAETGVHAPRLRPRRSARRPQPPERLERKGALS
ncbi:MAG: hypothetical protein ACFFCS_27110 [Candidatus Hodarchaeota archaeon]